MKCLVIGAGGVGGSLAALLALAGNEVTCVARGEHKEKMLAHGLRFHSGIKGEQVVPCYVYDGTEERPGEIGVATTETYRGKAELILVCVKGYSVDSVADCIVRASGERTVVLPILNVYGSGPRIARACPGSRVIDGCIYIVGYIQAPGEVTQSGQVCKLVFGARPGDGVSPEELETVRRTLADAGVKAILSEDIDRDTFDRIDRLWRLKKAIFRKIGSLNCHAYLLEKLQKKDDHVDFTSTYILSIIQTNVRI